LDNANVYHASTQSVVNDRVAPFYKAFLGDKNIPEVRLLDFSQVILFN
jgi:hypothetical protein